VTSCDETSKESFPNEKRNFKKFGRLVAILVLAVVAPITYVLRGGFRRLEMTPYPVPRAAFNNWKDVLGHPSEISIRTLQTGVVHMDACLNLDPGSPRQTECDHRPRDLPVLVHWVHHPKLGDFLIDTGFDDSFAKHPPYGNYSEAMKFFNWTNSITNRQEFGTDLATQLARLNVHPAAVFFTHLHPDHTGGVPALPPQTRLIFGDAEAGFLARAAVANHFTRKSHFSTIDFSAVPAMAPLGSSVDLFGDGSFWAISAPGHTDDDIAYLINGPQPALLTGDASHFRWAFNAGVGPRGWNHAGTARGHVSLEQLRAFARAYPNVKIIFGHEAEGP
jgi:glyoxylase-like metal-dependent hydrolase (beta-lactamase superfamily II)